jgi:hypothetical protein
MQASSVVAVQRASKAASIEVEAQEEYIIVFIDYCQSSMISYSKKKYLYYVIYSQDYIP